MTEAKGGERYEFPLISILHCDDRLNKHEMFPWRTTIKRSLRSESENKAVIHCGDNCYAGRTDGRLGWQGLLLVPTHPLSHLTGALFKL